MEAEAEAALRESSVIEVQHQLIGETAPLFFYLPPRADRFRSSRILVPADDDHQCVGVD